MKKQTMQYAVETKNGIVQKIGKSTIYQPKIQYNQKKTKWFDDNILLKTNKK